MLRAICVVVIFLLSGIASAQYFGQNKVRYRDFNFRVLKTRHFDIYYYPEERTAADAAGRMAERWYDRLSKILNFQLSARQPVILYGSHPAFEQTTLTPEMIGPGTGGFTEPLRRRVVMPLAGPLAESDHVLGHELVHAFQFEILMPHGPVMQEQSDNLPLWFIEGMAEYLSIGPDDPNTTMWIRDALARKDMPSIKDMDNPKYFPYRYGEAFWAYIGGRYGDEVIGKMLMVGARAGVKAAIKRVLGISEDDLSKQWHESLSSQKSVLSKTTPPSEVGHVIIPVKDRGDDNVSPSLSPDGKHLILFSSKDLFSIELFLANADTGEVERKITSAATSPHLNNLEFINSSGAWSSDGHRFAFGHVIGPNAVISVYDLDKGDVVRDFTLPKVREVFSPSWSPDGTHIAFSGLEGGLSNLYILDTSTGTVNHLTTGEFADLQPSWSPDGKTIAFVTDRFNSDLSSLSFGNYSIALMDAATHNISVLQTFTDSKSIDPSWSSDSGTLFFVSDRGGVPNVYRIGLADHVIRQVTNISTGVSGITALSPCLSVATRADRLVFSAFQNSGYSVVRMDGEANLAGMEPTMALDNLNAGILPPRKSDNGEVANLLDRPEQGLATGKSFQVKPYSPSLSLDYVAPPQVSAGFSTFGTLVAGGTAFHFSDTLDFHDLTVTAQTGFTSQGGHILRNLAGQAIYLNQRSRWNWGFAGGQIPYQSGYFTQAATTVNGEPAVVQNEVQVWQIERQVGAIAQYPISRARRVEFDLGYQNIGFAAESRTSAFSLIDGSQLALSRHDLPAPGGLNFAIGDTALVYDTSLFAGTSPIAGQRYRLQGGFAAGSANYFPVLADYRRYLHLARPLSIAGRVLHFGRYGAGAEDSRLQGYFLGYPSLVRGYDANSFSPGECGQQYAQTGSCPVFDRLVGSRLLVANAELRLETLGPLGIVPGTRRVPPLETALFYDVGEAWSRNQQPGFAGGPRHGISSYGAALRFNIFGFAVGQVDFVHPNDRPAKNWLWQFSLIPGF